jgi:hypothetical protein
MRSGRLTGPGKHFFVARRRIDAPVEKEPCCVQLAVSTGVEESRLDLFWTRFLLARATFVEIALEHVKPALAEVASKILHALNDLVTIRLAGIVQR